MFKANYHTHTYRCHHASGTEKEYVEQAISYGIKTLGFSDHTPYVGFPNGYYSGFRMNPEELSGYCESVNALKKEYAADIEIHLGLEAEYYPALFQRLCDFLKPYNIEYLILGQHCINNETDGLYSGDICHEKDLIRYVDQCCEALNTGCFSYLAHPDMVGFDRSAPAFSREMKRLCVCAKRLNIPLEINLLGIRAGRTYPCREFFKIAGETGNKVIFGADAHEPDVFESPFRSGEYEAERYLAEFGLEYEDNLILKGICK